MWACGRPYGLKVLEVFADAVVPRRPSTTASSSPFGLVHSGLCTAVAESIAVAGTTSAIGAGQATACLPSRASCLPPILEGTVRASANASCRHRGRTTWV